MAKLTDDHKAFIVTRLACFDGPSAVRDALEETYGVTVGLDQVVFYDPNTAKGKTDLHQKWKELYAATRERFIEDTSSIPVAHKAYRLRRVQRLLDNPDFADAPGIVRELLEYAAKEAGGALTNRRELTGKNGGPIETRDASLDELTTEQLLELAQKLAAA